MFLKPNLPMRFFLLLLFFLPVIQISAQEAGPGIGSLSVTAKKKGDGKYILHFTGTAREGSHVYDPNQVLLETPTTEIQFQDSAIKKDGDWQVENETRKMQSEIFEQEIIVQEGAVSWKLPISISGTVPATLQGTLLYT